MAKRVSEVVAEIECRPYPKENALPWTFCIIQEIEAENFNLNGMPATPEMLEAVKTGKVHMAMD